jgi:hypothetical protein
VAIVEAVVPSNRQGSRLDRRLVGVDDEMFQMQLGAPRKHLVQFGERARDKLCLAQVVTREWMSTHRGPIDVVPDVFEECGSVAVFQTFEHFTDMVRCDSHPISPFPSAFPACGSIQLLRNWRAWSKFSSNPVRCSRATVARLSWVTRRNDSGYRFGLWSCHNGFRGISGDEPRRSSFEAPSFGAAKAISATTS